MEDFKSLDGARSVARLFERLVGGGACRLADETRPFRQNVGSAHPTKVGNQPIKRGIGDLGAIDIHDWIGEACVLQKRR